MLTCKEITQLVSDGLDRNLTFLERSLVRFHLLYCVACRRYRRQIRFLRAAAVRYLRIIQSGKVPTRAVLSEAAREQISQALRRG
jgi:predicted anti-sigma-YlaC factor YlaD